MIRIKILLLMLLLPGFLIAQQHLTAEMAVREALEKNFNIRLARQDAAISSNNVTLGNAGFLPRVDLSTSLNNNLVNTRQQFLSGEEEVRQNARSANLSGGIHANWVVFDGMRMFVRHDQLKELQELGEINVRLELENSIAQVLATYYEIAMIEQQIAALENAAEIAGEILSVVESRRELGAASGIQVKQAQIEWNNARSNLLEHRERRESVKIQLKQLMGWDVNADFTIDGDISGENLPEWNLLHTSMLAQNTPLLISRKNISLAHLDLRQLQGQNFPEISLYTGYNYNRTQSEFGFMPYNRSNGMQYGVTMSLNLFNGNNLSRQKENARIAIESKQIREEAVRQEQEMHLLQIYNRFTSNMERVALEEENAAATVEILEVALERYKLGDISGIELREIQHNYLNAQSRLYLSKYLAKVAEIELLRLSGRLIGEE